MMVSLEQKPRLPPRVGEYQRSGGCHVVGALRHRQSRLNDRIKPCVSRYHCSYLPSTFNRLVISRAEPASAAAVELHAISRDVL